jgi:hypothetical protein
MGIGADPWEYFACLLYSAEVKNVCSSNCTPIRPSSMVLKSRRLPIPLPFHVRISSEIQRSIPVILHIICPASTILYAVLDTNYCNKSCTSPTLNKIYHLFLTKFQNLYWMRSKIFVLIRYPVGRLLRQLENHWTDSHELWCWRMLGNQSAFGFKISTTILHEDRHAFVRVSRVQLIKYVWERKTLSNESSWEKWNTHNVPNVFYSKIYIAR